jgi:hypothetical protein
MPCFVVQRAAGMTRSRAKGTRFESEVCNHLSPVLARVERRAGRGHRDGGDIAGVHGFGGDWVLECKALRELDVAGAMDEAEKERANAGARWCAAILKRRRRGVGDSYVVMTLEQFARLLSEEG